MAPGLQALNDRFPPNAPIPGRGLPQPEMLQIPTRQVRLVRAAGAFATSLVAAGTLALGPAAVIARLGSGGPVVVTPDAAPPHVLRLADTPREPFVRWLLDRPSQKFRARSTVVVAGATGSPRNRDDTVLMPCREPGLGGSAAACFAGRQLRWRPGAGETVALLRRPRPPPAPGIETSDCFAELTAFEPASSPPLRWRRPVFLLSSRI